MILKQSKKKSKPKNKSISVGPQVVIKRRNKKVENKTSKKNNNLQSKIHWNLNLN